MTNQLVQQKKTLKEIIAEQYQLCAKSPQYFMKKYCLIQHPTKGKIPFILYPFQETCLDEFMMNRYNIILKSRQLGLSTLTAAYALWRMIFKQDFQVLVIATGKDVAKNLITKVRIMYQNLPTWLKIPADTDNKMSLELSNGSRIVAISSAPERARSEALSLLILDEAAFIDKVEEIWTASQQTIATGGDCIVLSTPNGMGNWFHSMWLEAEEEANGFNTIKLHWTVHPERDQAWRDEQDKKLGKRKAAQECDTDFLTSGNTVVDMNIIQFYKETFAKEPQEKRSIDKGLWIWEYPDYTRSYVITADVARGDGSDYSAAHVFDIENMRQVAEYKGQAQTRDYGRLLAALGVEYNNAMVVVERENVGWDTIQELIDINYQNLFYSSNDLQYVDVHRQLTNKYRGEEKRLKPGFATTTRNRSLIINKLEHYFEDINMETQETSITVFSQRLLNELQTFIWKDGKAQAQSGRNDDLIMALAIFLWVRDTALRLRQEGIDLTKMILNKIGKSPQFEGIYRPDEAIRRDAWSLKLGKENVKLTDYL